MLHLAHVKLEVSHSKKYVSQVMQVLRPALDELTDRGYSRWTLADSQTDSGKKLVFDRIRSTPAALSAPDDPLAALSPEQRTLHDALTERGLSSAAARALVTAHDADRIRRQVDHFDHLLADGQPPKSAGWFVAAVEKDFGLPPALLEQLRRREARAQAADAEAARQADAEAARAHAAQHRAAEHAATQDRLADLSPDEHANLQARAVAALDSINRARFRDHGLDARGLRPLVEAKMLELLDANEAAG